MLFLNGWFYVFVALSAVIYRVLPARARLSWLLLLTLGWLAWALPQTLLVFGVVSLLSSWAAWWIAKSEEHRSRRANIASGVLVVTIVGARLAFPVFGGLQIAASEKMNETFVLIGIAYLALKVHHYFREVAYDQNSVLPLTSLFLYFAYLPTITAGPIVRVQEWKALARCETPEPAWLDFDVGTRRVLWGLAKKILAVPLLTALSSLPGAKALGPVLLVPASLIAIYLDFSGYSDIAIGSARLMGHRLRENFDSPFTATSLSHFWRKWHVTMGDWLREHIFIPLGGMRASRLRAAATSALVMLFCGLWHAFDLRFVLWGVYHAVLLMGEGLLGVKPLPPSAPASALALRRSLVFVAMCGSAVFFIPEFWTSE